MSRWRETRRLDEHLFIKDLQVVFPKVLGAAEECRFRKTKARITPRLRQESFPRAGDSGFRLCRHIFYHNRGFGRNGGNSTISDGKGEPLDVLRK